MQKNSQNFFKVSANTKLYKFDNNGVRLVSKLTVKSINCRN